MLRVHGGIIRALGVRFSAFGRAVVSVPSNIAERKDARPIGTQ
jgi:hypothetical protein